MKNKVLIMDTSILCCWLNVPGKETCGRNDDQWDKARVEALVKGETENGAIIVLPLATIIETGNHISQAPKNRYQCASKLGEIINLAVDEQSPWAAFSEQSNLWTSIELKRLAVEWPKKAAEQLSLGDITIIAIAEFYAKIGKYVVEIVTADEGLKAYQPAIQIQKPRRRMH